MFVFFGGGGKEAKLSIGKKRLCLDGFKESWSNFGERRCKNTFVQIRIITEEGFLVVYVCMSKGTPMAPFSKFIFIFVIFIFTLGWAIFYLAI